METLILAVISRLFALRNHHSFPHPDVAPPNDALNCVRILTRLLPFVYESEKLEPWEEQFFWTPRRKRTRRSDENGNEVMFEGDGGAKKDIEDAPEFQEVKPLAEELIDTLLDLLFYTDFTLPKVPGKHETVHLSIWQSGVGCNSAIGTSKELENNRMEILRLLLTLASKSIYTTASKGKPCPFSHIGRKLTSIDVLPVQGVEAITYMTTLPNKQLVLTLLCSLLNTV